MRGVFEALGQPARRVILEMLGNTERAVGDVVAGIQSRWPMSQPAVSQHLRVLREARLVRVRAEGTQRLYSVDPEGVAAAEAWLARLVDASGPFAQPLDALATEVARGRKSRQAHDVSVDRDSQSA